MKKIITQICGGGGLKATQIVIKMKNLLIKKSIAHNFISDVGLFYI